MLRAKTRHFLGNAVANEKELFLKALSYFE